MTFVPHNESGGVCSQGGGGCRGLLSVKHPLVAVACLCLRPLPSMRQANLRWPSSERSVGIGSPHILSIYCHFCGPAEPKENWAVYQNVIYYLHYTLITIIANIIICFHVELSVRPMYESLARGRLSNLLYSLFLSLCVPGIEGGSVFGSVSSVHFSLHFTNFSSYL